MRRDHLDTRLSSAERAARLLDELTLDEKCGQMVGIWPWDLITPDEVRRGTVNANEVDHCVRRILEAKIDLGLFEDPYRASPSTSTPRNRLGTA